MISIEEALRIVMENVPKPVVEEATPEEACGRVLAEEIIAPEPSPRYTSSAMDGFAVRWEDVAGCSEEEPVSLDIAGESRAGAPFTGELAQGTAARVSTGAVLPPGADTVVPLEDASEANGRVSIRRADGRARHVRPQGEEFWKGEVVFERNEVLNPASVGLLASLGIERVKVYARPAVALVVTGSEFASRSGEIEPWRIRDSNTAMLRAAVLSSGAGLVYRARVRDDFEEIEASIRAALESASIVVVSGGVSVGPHDLVKPVAERLGLETLFWRVEQKPGKPLFLAGKEGGLLFGLPGNPVSALNCYAYYVHPLLQAMQMRPFRWRKERAILERAASNRGRRPLFLRCRLIRDGDGPRADPIEKQGSHILSSLARAAGFILLDGGSELPAGSEVEVFVYPWI